MYKFDICRTINLWVISFLVKIQKKFRALIKHYFFTKNTIEAKACLVKHYSDFAPGKSTIEKWFARLKRHEISTEDDARSARPNEAVTDENIKITLKIILDNHKFKLIKITETLSISNKRVGHVNDSIWFEYFDMQKFSSKWVSQSTKNYNDLMILSSFWSCSTVLNMKFCVDIWQCMKHGSIILHRSPIYVRRKSWPARLWHQYFRMRRILYSKSILKGKKP